MKQRVMNEIPIKVIRYFLTALAVLLSQPCFAPPSVPVDVTSIEGQLSLLQAILARHPGLVNENLGFRRNLFEILADVSRVRGALGSNSASLEIGDTHLVGGVFFGSAAQYDQTAIGRLRQTLSKNADMLHLTTFTSLSNDLRRLKALKLPNGENEAQFRTFFRLLPLIYDADGNAISSTREQVLQAIGNTPAGELDNAYQDRFRNYLRPRASAALKNDAQFKGWLDSTSNQFIQNEIVPHFAPKSPDGQVTSRRTISVERVPPIVGLLVRNFGRDCGLGSVPFFPLLEYTCYLPLSNPYLA
jgi:hypothetical protein